MLNTAELLAANFPEPLRKLFLDAFTGGSLLSVRRAAKALKDAALPEGPEIKLNLMASFSAESLIPPLELALRAIPCRPVLELAPFNSIDQQLLDPSSAAYSKGVFANVVLWRLEEVFPEAFFPSQYRATGQLEKKLDAVRRRIASMVEAYARHGKVPLLISTFPIPAAVSAPVFQSQQFPGALSALATLNSELYQLVAGHEHVRILDLFYWSSYVGCPAFYDSQMDFYARQPLRAAAAGSLACFIARNVRPMLVPRRKVLAVDLDNTLWGGILGEDGVSRLQVGNDFPGNVFLRIQREILELKERGILLVLLSKNNEADVEAAFRQLPDLLLKWEDFVCRKVDFNPKYLNLREAAKQLGLGTDSFVLVDDSDFEREQMRSYHPEVLILNRRTDPLDILRSLQETDAFDGHQLSAEDRRRHEEYQLRSQRSTEGHENDLTGFLQSLELQAFIEPIGPRNLDRVAQLIAKTNQFNLTTRRHTLDALQEMIAAAGTIGLVVRLKDKFGDQGIVGLLLAVADAKPDMLRVDTFLVSCRALGRGVEEALWATLLQKAYGAGAQSLCAEYIATPKNGLVNQLYDRFGLQREREEGSTVLYRLQPVVPAQQPSWIEVFTNDHEHP